MNCIVCGVGAVSLFSKVAGVDYFQCARCQSIHADAAFIGEVYSKSNHYEDNYWRVECSAARQRSFGSSLNRVAEVFLYARKPIEKFIDIGTGPGYLLDALSILMPKYSHIFHGVEAFPPPAQFRSHHKNYSVGRLGEVGMKFDAGCCIEVIEHLSPDMLKTLIEEMASTSNPGALYYFNSAQPSFVRDTDPSYLDPYARGHICSYSLAALEEIFSLFGFTVIPLPGRDWAFLAEFGRLDDSAPNCETLMKRVWNPVHSNSNMLKENGFGEFMYSSGVESARCYFEAHTAKERTQWALSLKSQLLGQ